MNRTERLLDLITYMLNAREPVSWQEIKNHFPEDYAQGVEESNQRKFERDKAELISLGIPIDYHSGAGTKKEGYSIEKEKLFLPEVRFKLGKDTQHIQKRLPSRCGRIYGLPCCPQGDALILKLVDYVL